MIYDLFFRRFSYIVKRNNQFRSEKELTDMKYQIPKLRMLNKVPVNAICSHGSSAAGGNCIGTGNVATDGCKAGAAANVTNCEAGGVADELGPLACNDGGTPNIACSEGTQV